MAHKYGLQENPQALQHRQKLHLDHVPHGMLDKDMSCRNAHTRGNKSGRTPQGPEGRCGQMRWLYCKLLGAGSSQSCLRICDPPFQSACVVGAQDAEESEGERELQSDSDMCSALHAVLFVLLPDQDEAAEVAAIV